MGVLRDLEGRLGRWTDQLTARWLGGHPTTQRLAASLVEQLRTAPAPERGEALLNSFTIHLQPDDLARLGDLDIVRAALLARLRQEADGRRLRWLGRPRVSLVSAPAAAPGEVSIDVAAEPGAGAAELRPSSGGPAFRLSGAQVLIGRDADYGVRLEEAGVSRRHARLEAMTDHWRVIDLGSTNGTLVNGVRVSAQALCDGDELRCGSVRLRFREL